MWGKSSNYSLEVLGNILKGKRLSKLNWKSDFRGIWKEKFLKR